MLHHIAWFSGAPVSLHPSDGLVSPDTTVCARCLVPARELEKLGVPCSVFGNLEGADPAHVSSHLRKLGVDMVVIGKLSANSLLQLTRTAKHLGCYVIADFATITELPDDMNSLLGVTDLMVGATDEVAQAILARGGLEPIVIASCATDTASDAARAPAIARQWLSHFRTLKQKPPACANTNIPAV